MRGDREQQTGSSAGVGISHGSGRARGVLTQQGIHLQEGRARAVQLAMQVPPTTC